MIGSLVSIIKSDKFLYVGNNIVLVLFSLLRTYITMKFLGFYDMGLVAMMLSIMEFLGMLQFGLLNGAFRLYFVFPNELNRKVNDLLYTFFLILLITTLILGGGYYMSSTSLKIDVVIVVLVGIVFGVLSIVKNWIQNQLIAANSLSLINQLNILSSIISISWLLLIPIFPLLAAILGVTSQPLVFIVGAYIRKRELLPRHFFLSKKLAVRLLLIGFVPFLAGILVKLFDQIERWGIINLLSIEELGKYNLVILYSSLFQLIPNSIMQVFYPKAIGFFKAGENSKFKNEWYTLIKLLGIYLIVALLLTIFLMPIIVEWLLPKYLIGVQFVWYIIPFLLTQTAMICLDFIYTIVAKYKIMLISYLSSVVVFFVLIYSIGNFDIIKLEYFPSAKSLSGLLFFLISLTGFWFYFYKKYLKNEHN